MNQSGIVYSWLFLLLLVSCSPPQKKDTTREDGYNDYEQDQQPEKSSAGKTHTVEIKQMKFIPDKLIVQKGDKIVWVNKDFVDHDVTEQSSKAWTSSKLPANASWSMVITRNEIYYCSIHVVMKGEILVDDKSVASNKRIIADVQTSDITMCR